MSRGGDIAGNTTRETRKAMGHPSTLRARGTNFAANITQRLASHPCGAFMLRVSSRGSRARRLRTTTTDAEQREELRQYVRLPNATISWKHD